MWKALVILVRLPFTLLGIFLASVIGVPVILVARQNGIDWRHVGTSHCVFVRPDGKTLPVPARRPIKAIYVKKFLELVEGA
jgi:hypothetical protein